LVEEVTMANDAPNRPVRSFLGTGWSFPPEFRGGGVVLTEDEEDIQASLTVLFRTTPGERFLQPKYGLDVGSALFEPLSTTMRTALADRARIAILLHEPRVNLVDLRVDSPDPNGGVLNIFVEYVVRATNSRFNLVFPFYDRDSNELRDAVGR
jgi:phage baseplate assembly protein W